MYGWHNLVDKLKTHGRFTNDEKKAIVITILVLAFIVGFDDGAESFALLHWLLNFLFVLFFVACAVMVKQLGYRVAALYNGFRPEYSIWWYGIAISLVVTLISKGSAWVLIPGSAFFHHLTIHRLGYFRYGSNTRAFSSIALASNIAVVLFGGIAKTIDIYFFAGANPWVNKFFVFTMAYAAWSLIPIPPLDGSKLLFESRLVFAFVFGCFAGYAILVALGVYSYIWALVIGVFVWLIFYIVFERGAWKGPV